MVLISIKKLVASSLLASFVTGTPVPDETKLLVRQGNFLAVTGATIGGTQPRLEIRTLQSQPDAWNLFLLAMERFKATDQAERSSYYQIAGIHGQPNIPWDGVQSTGVANTGYCPHSSNLFGTWHKPYLALFEQVLSQKAQEIAAEFPAGAQRDRYQSEAAKLRLPYWDWALNTATGADPLPNSIADTTARVTYPNGTAATIPNPLKRYDFHPLEPNVFSSPFNTRTFTWRGSTQPDNNVQIESRLTGQNQNIRNTLYQILTQFQSFNQFSNTGSEQTIFGSVEGIHDSIHSQFIGGHMAAVPVAAFDPIFWFHHANVDRIMSIFQYLYPNTYVTPFAQRRSTYMARAGSVWDANTPLWPFHSNTAGSFWTSNSARPITIHHYTYPELVGNPSNASLRATINTLYAPPVTALTSTDTLRLLNEPADTPTPPPPRAYLAVIDSPAQLSAGGGYSLSIFLGTPATSSPATWPLDPSWIGARNFLSSAQASGSDMVRGNVELTQALQEAFDKGDLAGLDEETVVGYLKERLTWRVGMEEREGSVGDVRGLKVEVWSTEVEVPTGEDGFPVYVGGFKVHSEVTEGRVRGA